MLGINAKDDRLLKPVLALLQKTRDLARNDLRALVDHERPVEVLLVVNPILDLLAFAIQLAGLGAVTLDVPIDVDFDHFVGREEPVVDALLQGVAVDRFTEVVNVGW